MHVVQWRCTCRHKLSPRIQTCLMAHKSRTVVAAEHPQLRSCAVKADAPPHTRGSAAACRQQSPGARLDVELMQLVADRAASSKHPDVALRDVESRGFAGGRGHPTSNSDRGPPGDGDVVLVQIVGRSKRCNRPALGCQPRPCAASCKLAVHSIRDTLQGGLRTGAAAQHKEHALPVAETHRVSRARRRAACGLREVRPRACRRHVLEEVVEQSRIAA
eukprot:1353449-Rhodomonas_salina.1